MKRTVVTLVAVGLLAGSLAAPVEAKKKKKKKPPAPVATLVPGELKYFPHYPDDGAGGCTATQYMDLQDTPDTTCSTTAQVAQEVLAATGQELVAYTYPATEGVPFILDASRKLTGEITLRGTVSVQAKAQLVLSGTVGGADAVIAEGETAAGNGAASNSATAPVGGGPKVDLPGPAVTVPIELEIDKALDKLEVTALTLTITVRGVHRGHIDLDRNPTNIVVPIFTQG